MKKKHLITLEKREKQVFFQRVDGNIRLIFKINTILQYVRRRK